MNRKLLFYGLLTRILMFALMYLAFYSHFPGRPPAPLGYESGQGILDWSPLNPLMPYDAGHYVNIAENGYIRELTVWFPFYPLLVKILGTITGNYGLAAVIIANISFFAALELVYRLAALDYKKEVAFTAALSVIFFPAGVFFNVAYTESLFLALVVGAVYAARNEYWWWAGILGGLAALTRNMGILVFPVLLVEFFTGRHKTGLFSGHSGRLKPGAGLIMAPFLSFLYPGFLMVRFSDPLAFFHGQSGHFRDITIPGWGVAADIFSMLKAPLDPFNFIILLNIMTLSLGLAAFVYIKRASYRLYLLIYLLTVSAMPLVGGNMPHTTGLFRFGLGMFPVYLFLGRYLYDRKGRFMIVWLSIFILCLIAVLIAQKVYLA